MLCSNGFVFVLAEMSTAERSTAFILLSETGSGNDTPNLVIDEEPQTEKDIYNPFKSCPVFSHGNFQRT